MKTILFPTDFSACSERAVEYASAYAEKLNAKIILLHCRHIPVMIPSEFDSIQLAETEGEVYKAAEKDLNQFTEKHFKNKNIPLEKSIKLWYADESIVTIAEEKNADLVVMGTTGASGIKELVVGSIASSVATKASCPVLVVPEHARYSPFKKIVYATNYNDKEFEALQLLSDIAALFDAEIHIVHIEDALRTDERVRNLFDAFAEEAVKKINYKKMAFHFISGIRLTETLNGFIEEHAFDLLSLSARKRNLFAKLFDRSLSKKLACHSHIPVLAFHIK